MRIHGMTPRGAARVARSPLHEGRFGRMFRKLPAAPEYSVEVLTALAESMREPGGATGGWNQGGAQPPDGDNPEIPSGYTYFGQFLDHDITFDPTSRLQTSNDPDALVDFRTPRLDLDSLYGSGPFDEPFQYDQQRDNRMLLSDNGAGDVDLPRNSQGIALIGDPRNDENVIVSGLQIVMLQLHNKLADDVDADPAVPEADRFDETRRRLRWHYQWVVVHDFLPRICPPELITRLLALEDGVPGWKLRFYRPTKNAYLPVEFSAAAYRFGHSMVRAAYDLNATIGVKPIFVAGDDQPAGSDLRGGQTLLPGWTVDWARFLPIDGSAPQPSRRIDTHLSPPLFDLPRFPATQPQSLALRNLLRGQALKLPSGQDVAKTIGERPLSGADLGGVVDPTPLWFYILKEPELEAGNGGHRLGPVGARIVAEVLLGLLRADPSSYLNVTPTWAPTLPGRSGHDDTFGLADLIRSTR